VRQRVRGREREEMGHTSRAKTRGAGVVLCFRMNDSAQRSTRIPASRTSHISYPTRSSAPASSPLLLPVRSALAAHSHRSHGTITHAPSLKRKPCPPLALRSHP
jgi:hypothetical protein